MPAIGSHALHAAECSTVIDCTITKRTFSIHAYHRVRQRIAAALHGLVQTIVTVLYLLYCIGFMLCSSRCLLHVFYSDIYFMHGPFLVSVAEVCLILYSLCCDVHISRVKLLQIHACMLLSKKYMHNNNM